MEDFEGLTSNYISLQNIFFASIMLFTLLHLFANFSYYSK